MRAWTEIDAARLTANFQTLQQAAGDTQVLAVIKANAYGHGVQRCAPILARAGARWFGVTDAAEGLLVRAALHYAGLPGEGPEAPHIVVMSGSLPGETANLSAHNLTPVVWTPAQIAALSDMKQTAVQIEIDTGMSRQGVRPGPDLDALLAAIRTTGLTVEGLFTHLCASEVAHCSITETQKQRFEASVHQVLAAGVQPMWLHIGNSSTLDNPSQIAPWLQSLAAASGARPLVRAGLALYGYTLPIQHPGSPAVDAAVQPKLLPVLSWKARILALRDLSPGDTVGYGATFTAPAPMRVALLPVGYADGLRRELSNPGTHSATSGGWVIAHDRDGRPHRCPILGRVSMNLTVVDITGVPSLTEADTVTLLGDGITADDHARLCGTISYEILCGIRDPKVPKLS